MSSHSTSQILSPPQSDIHAAAAGANHSGSMAWPTLLRSQRVRRHTGTTSMTRPDVLRRAHLCVTATQGVGAGAH